MTTSTKIENLERECRLEYIQNHTKETEEYYTRIGCQIDAIAKDAERYQESIDDLLKIFRAYGDSKHITETVKHALLEVADIISNAIQFRMREVQDLKTLGTCFCNYHSICQQLKDGVKQNRQRSRLQKFNDKMFSYTRHESMDKNGSGIEQLAVNFEREMLKDIKRYLQKFCTIQLQFSAKMLETYTRAYQHASLINEEDDLEEFCTTLDQQGRTKHNASVKLSSKNNSLGSFGSLIDLITLKKKEKEVNDNDSLK